MGTLLNEELYKRALYNMNDAKITIMGYAMAFFIFRVFWRDIILLNRYMTDTRRMGVM